MQEQELVLVAQEESEIIHHFLFHHLHPLRIELVLINNINAILKFVRDLSHPICKKHRPPKRVPRQLVRR